MIDFFKLSSFFFFYFMFQNRMKLDLLKPGSSQRVVRHNNVMLLGNLLEMQAIGLHFRDTEKETLGDRIKKFLFKTLQGMLMLTKV